MRPAMQSFCKLGVLQEVIFSFIFNLQFETPLRCKKKLGRYDCIEKRVKYMMSFFLGPVHLSRGSGQPG